MTTTTPLPPPPQPLPNSKIEYIIIILIIVLSIPYAAYLSWSCNTGLGISTGLKLLYAFFAGLGNVGYLMFYFVYRLGICGPWAPKQSVQSSAYGGKNVIKYH